MTAAEYRKLGKKKKANLFKKPSLKEPHLGDTVKITERPKAELVRLVKIIEELPDNVKVMHLIPEGSKGLLEYYQKFKPMNTETRKETLYFPPDGEKPEGRFCQTCHKEVDKETKVCECGSRSFITIEQPKIESHG